MVILAAVIIVVISFWLHNRRGKEQKIVRGVLQKTKEIERTWREINTRSESGERLSHAQEWLFDNFYLVQQKKNAVCGTLSRSLYRNLKKADGVPHAYLAAREICGAYSYRLHEEDIVNGLNAYQEKVVLKNADIWAFEAFLNICLIERIHTACQDASSGEADEAQTEIDMASCILSMVSISNANWDTIFDYVSRTEQILLEDPTNTYRNMDNATKNYYRQSVEKLSKKLKVPETEIAQCAINMAKDPLADNNRRRHVGYYLIDKGRSRLLAQYQAKACGSLRIKQALVRRAGPLYFTTVFGLTALCCALLSVAGWLAGYAWHINLIFILLCILPVSEIVIKMVNWATLHMIHIKPVPKLKLDRIPVEGAAFVIVPALLTSASRARELVRSLEVMYAANRSENLYFALLGDYKDGRTEKAKQDEEIAAAALAEVERLNGIYGPRFFYFNRKRSYDAASEKYLGWERKRGAILEFVRLLHGMKTTYTVRSSEELPQVHYVLTLDSDTKLRKSTALQLIGAMLHPLNRPVVDEKRGIVTDGYALLQPRVDVDVDSANRSWFSRIFAGQGGIDPYASAVSDIYQDVFGEGIFTGKGIFDAEVYFKLLDGMIPENRVLSHDLLEGSFLRAGLVTDISVEDGFPHQYLSYAKRQHRWIRGDWQLLPYLLPRIRRADGQKIKNPLPFLARFKIFDNLRRPLVTAGILALIKFAFIVRSGFFFLPLLVAAAALLAGLISCSVDSALSGTLHFGEKGFLRGESGLARTAKEIGLLFLFLPYQTYTALDAVCRSLWRTLFSKKKMLEWVTAEEAEKRHNSGAANAYREMYVQIGSGLILVALSAFFIREALWLAIVFLAVWSFGPLIADWISRPIRSGEKLAEEDTAFLRNAALKTWRYYADFCGARENWLPPDNYQKQPFKGLAHRTSPTNIGLLLACLTAGWDFGYLSSSQLLRRVENTLNTIDRLEKMNGQLFNWYDTRTLAPLSPRFISTVDNGNFVCLLIAVKQALLSLPGEKRPELRMLSGVRDVLAQLGRETEKIDSLLAAGAPRAEILAVLADIRKSTTANDYWSQTLREMIDCIAGGAELSADGGQAAALAGRIDRLVSESDFSFLYNTKRRLFSVGYNVEEKSQINSYYDLLATEARQTSFIAVAKGDVPERHWFRLSRELVLGGGGAALVSWTGTMFEYLMPLLLMRSAPTTLLGRTYQNAVRCQIAYGKKRGHAVWGVSECAFYSFDRELNYQYKALGTPKLALKRDTHVDYVVSPYSSCLALMVEPQSATDNLRAMKRMGMMGDYGFYESVDFTKNHMFEEKEYEIIKSYMVHHQGMSLLAFDNVVNGGIMQKRFAEEACVSGCRYLLDERFPSGVPLMRNAEAAHRRDETGQGGAEPYGERFESLEDVPRSYVLSNGNITECINDRGAGFISFGSIRLNRFEPSDFVHPHGYFLYAREEREGIWRGLTPAPMEESCFLSGEFGHGGAVFKGRLEKLELQMTVTLAAEDSVELRSVKAVNHGPDTRLELAGFFEVILTNAGADEAHPAFSNLFIYTQFLEGEQILVASRRPREKDGKSYFAAFTVTPGRAVSFETDRMKFLGRGRDVRNPAALAAPEFSCTEGAVLDPVMAWRTQFSVPAGAEAETVFVTAVAETLEDAVRLCRMYRGASAVQNRETLAERIQVENNLLRLQDGEEAFFLRLYSLLLLPDARQKREYLDIMRENQLGQQELWAFGVSGDLPIVLLRMADRAADKMLETLIRALLYFRFKGIRFDLAVLDESPGDYHDSVCRSVDEVVSQYHIAHLKQADGGVFVIPGDKATQEQKNLFLTVARVVFDGAEPLEEQLG